MKLMTKEMKSYLEFKIKQYGNITGFDFKQVNAKDKLKKLIKPRLKSFIMEAMAAGCR